MGAFQLQLSPKEEYSNKIYTEILCAICTKAIEIRGAIITSKIIPSVLYPLGERDAKKLAPILGVKKGNAASAALLIYSAASILGLKIEILKLDPRNSQERADKCPYGDAVRRYKDPILCEACNEYNKGMVEFLGVKFVRSKMVMSEGHTSCFANFMCLSPSEESIPSNARIEFVIAIGKLVTNRNKLTVSTLSTILNDGSDLATSLLGQAGAMSAASNAFVAGAYQGPIFSKTLNLTESVADAAKLVSEVRETLECDVHSYISGAGFSLYTKNCPHREKCGAGNFIETICTSYTKGLLERFGKFEIKTDLSRPVCRQEFLQTAPHTEKETAEKGGVGQIAS